MKIKIKNILNSDGKIVNKKVKIFGWVKSIRDQKSFSFIEINDGSALSNIQCIIESDNKNYPETKKITTGSSIMVEGEVLTSIGKNQKYEVKIQNFVIFGLSPEDYPLQKKRHSFEYLRTIAHLRPRTNTQGALTRLRSSLIFYSHKFFKDRDFLYIQSPIITASDTEGAGDLFRVTTLDDLKKPDREDFFKEKTYLTVSGQLNAEAFACSLSDVYVFSPTFRAENSHTSRHLGEFWMLEPEMAFADLNDNMNIAEDYIKYMIEMALKENIEDMDFFDKFIENGLIERLENVKKSKFERVSYTEAVDILMKSDKKFEYQVSWGCDLQSEHERFLAEEHFKKPVIVYNYPKELKAFYMRNNDDNKTVAAMDILVPKIGEIVGGSQREERYDVLLKKMQEKNLDLEIYKWYLELRKYGTVPHAGFGVGFERLLQFISGIENIRDVIAFPRFAGSCKF
ncbi:MAG: asparagine--tRNA ligase [Chlamydiae bacterium RIFCSPLOWO2_01_FULL_28_7]|nr:MAG: asparagine--tRNA ligase [Chlamydiae bacterium RIFCSPLOWO2_01_FULL_28_7]